MKLLTIFLAQLSVSLCGVFVQKLTWRESEKSKMIKTGNWVEYNKFQENLRAISLANAQKRNITERFMDYYDAEYLATVTIGTPPQEFNVVLDTGSTDFWIPSINCKKFPCEEKHRFNPAESSTYAKVGGEWNMDYGKGGAFTNGYYGEDTVRFGTKDNTFLTIRQVRIGEAMEIGSVWHHQPMDGILGFAFQSLSPNGVDGGQITFGGVDTDHCGEVTYADLTNAAFWQFTVDRVEMGGSSHEGPFEVVSDTGASFIRGPIDIISSMLQKISAQNLEGFWVADCAIATTLDITIGGKVYSIQPENYLLDSKIDDKCVLAIADLDGFWRDRYSFILGAPFLRQFCHIYDMEKERIGFATVLGRASSDK